jgi:serine/threonine-protein kinase RsbW
MTDEMAGASAVSARGTTPGTPAASAGAGTTSAGAGTTSAGVAARAVASPGGIATTHQPHDDAPADEVTVRLPADGAYLSVLRTATAGLAARLDFTLDDIEDLRIAVDEACAMLLSQAIPGSSLECGFALEPDGMTIRVSAECLDPRAPAADTFAWTVLTALAGSVHAHAGPDDRLTIVMRKGRPRPRSA